MGAETKQLEQIRAKRIEFDLRKELVGTKSVKELKEANVGLEEQLNEQLAKKEAAAIEIDKLEAEGHERVNQRTGIGSIQLEQEIQKPKEIIQPPIEEKTIEEVQEEMSGPQLLAQAMSNFTKNSPGHLAPQIVTEQPSELDKIKEEFRHFKEMVIKQMASIGGGGEVNLLKLDDVDTSSIGNGKVLSYNSSTGKLEFTTSSSGSSTLVDLSDVDDSGLADDTIMVYNSSTGKFEFTTNVDGGTVT